jgi:hypothetical protein
MTEQICAYCGRPRRKNTDICGNCGASQWMQNKRAKELTKDGFVKRPPIHPTGKAWK